VVYIPSSVKALAVSGLVSIVLAPSAMAQSSGNEAAYHNLLQAIAAQKLSLAQQQMYVAEQNGEISSLNAQIKNVDGLKASLAPMVDKMTAGIARQIRSDYPFEMDMRMPRLQRLEEVVSDPKVPVSDKYRKALNVYKIEVNYGQSLDAKKGNHPLTPTIRVGDDERFEKDEKGKFKLDKNNEKIEIFDGSYLRYGRLAYVYMQADSSEALRYDLTTKEWVQLPKGKIADIRRGVRIAAGEAAVNVVRAPVIKTAGASEG